MKKGVTLFFHGLSSWRELWVAMFSLSMFRHLLFKELEKTLGKVFWIFKMDKKNVQK